MDIRENVLQKRYFMKDSEGNVIEDWEGLCKRVSKALSTTEEEEKQFFNVIFNCLFLPNTPTLVNAGKKEKLSWSACFSLPIEDSIESIFDAVKTSAIIYKSGGGVGYNFSKLRAKNSLVGSTKGVASGPVSFMQVFDAATEAIKQGGVRRGAAIGILNCDHPDILDFIKCKSIEGKMSNFNISVGITNKFMEDVKNKEPRTLEIWNAIVDRAWENGEPGLVFFDTVNKYNLTPHLGRMESCNPCVVGNTLVAVADGRNMVTIQKLAEEEKDIPVYCLDISKDELCIKYGRNPRKTGSKVPVYKVYLTNNESIIVSNNHKFILSSGGEKTTLELKSGDSLFSFSKHQYPNTTTGKLYWNLSVKSNEIKEHKLLGEFYYGKIPSTNCFHHKNFNSLDNRKENIQVVLKSFHNKIHHDFIGEKNPMWGKHHSKETKLKIKQKAIKRMTDVYKQNLSEKLKYAWLENRESFNIGLKKLAENRLKETQLKTDLPCILIDNYVYVKKNCEVCGEEMLLHFFQREKAFCSHSCGNKGRYGTHKISNNELLEMGIKCKENTGKLTWKSWIKFGENINNRPNHKILKQRFGSFNSFKDKVASFNHKVIKVEFVGYEDVYNITVDNFHNICSYKIKRPLLKME